MIAYFAALSLFRPIQTLKAHALDLSAGKYDASLELDRNDELGDLAKALRLLGSHLTTYRERMNSQRADLEQQ